MHWVGVGNGILLSLLPAAWKSGFVKCMVARGNFETAMSWKDGSLSHAVITSRDGGICVLRTAQPLTVNGKAARSKRIASQSVQYETTFATEKGKRYQIGLSK